MLHVQEGQCGLCTHFGEGHAPVGVLTQIRTSLEAKEDLVEDCGTGRRSCPTAFEGDGRQRLRRF